ncbi:MAG: nucleotidyltransferase family protein [Pseudomonadales bacterium]|jgi:CTP:molybdopterin cytidylyltransferase MocA|nr:nucleotidyltransferase family protein [Pseudomonadales bacterium]
MTTVALGVLAGERTGPSEISTAEAVPLKVLVDIAGAPMLQRVLGVVSAARVGSPLYICGPGRPQLPAAPWLVEAIERGELHWLPPQDSPSRSARAVVEAAFGAASPADAVALTTGDHPLLRAETLTAFIEDALATDADTVIGLASYDRVKAAYPHSRRTALRFAGQAWCGCNLFMFRSRKASAVLDFWQRVEGLRKQPHRILGALGATFVARYLAGRLPLEDALARLGDLTGARIATVPILDPDAAVDVDNLADLATVRSRWAQRSAASGSGQGRADAGASAPAGDGNSKV